MCIRAIRSALVGALGVALSLALGAAFAQSVYRLTDLGTLGGETIGTVINAAGEVAGHAITSDGFAHAFLWDGTTIRDLGTLGGTFSRGVSINATGQVAGSSSTTDDAAQHAFLWDGKTMQDLGTLGGTDSTSHDINDAGQVTGDASTTEENGRAFLWDGTTMQDLGTLGGTFVSAGRAINALGHVAGVSFTTGNLALHPFLWNGTTMQDLGTLGGTFGSVTAINDLDQVTGQARTDNGAFHAFLWNGATMQDLGTLGGTHSGGIAINATGQVTGVADTTGDAEQHAFLWNGTTMQDLGTLGGDFSIGSAINASGQVAGFSGHAFLWDGSTLHDLNALIDPADPLRSHVTVHSAPGINDLGQIVALGIDSQLIGTRTYLVSPAAPDDLTAIGGIAGKGRSRAAVVDLAWSDNFLDETGYIVERSAVMGKAKKKRLCGTFTAIGTASENSIGFRDNGVSRRTQYCYQLRVLRPTVVPTPSNIASIRTN